MLHGGDKPGTEPVDRMDVPSFDRVLKHDLRRGRVHEFALGEGRACGDIVFVPNNSQSENNDDEDGHLLVLTHVLAEDRAGKASARGGSRGSRRCACPCACLRVSQRVRARLGAPRHLVIVD